MSDIRDYMLTVDNDTAGAEEIAYTTARSNNYSLFIYLTEAAD